MRCSSRTRSTAIAFVVAAGCGLAAGAAGAMPMAGPGKTAEPVEAVVRQVAHREKEWNWHGDWLRQGPWADHDIQGIVITRRKFSPVIAPWGAHLLIRCSAKHRRVDPATGTYLTRRGKRRVCR